MDDKGTSGGSAELTGVVWTVADLAAAADVTTGRVRQLLRAGTLRGLKVGGRWLIPDQEARWWLTHGRKWGRPPARPKQLTIDLDENGT